jgi:hypothetical protein
MNYDVTSKLWLKSIKSGKGNLTNCAWTTLKISVSTIIVATYLNLTLDQLRLALRQPAERLELGFGIDYVHTFDETTLIK